MHNPTKDPIKIQNRFEYLDATNGAEENRPTKTADVRMEDLVKIAAKTSEIKSSRQSRKQLGRWMRREKKRRTRAEEEEAMREIAQLTRAEPDVGNGRGISLFEVKGKEGKPQISNLADFQGWREIEVTIDSGACDTVMPLSMCSEITLHESERQRGRMEYEVANGETIPNEGERHCLMMTSGATTPKRITFQVADVHKAFLSITRVADAGYECHLNKTGGYLLDAY